MGHQSYILPYNTEEEKKHILEVIRQHNQFEDPEDADENYDPPVGEELTQICNVRMLRKKRPKYLMLYTHAILCGNGGGRMHTFDWFYDHDVNAFAFDSSMPKFISAESTWEIIHQDGKVYKQSKKKNVEFELVDDYNWRKKDTTPTKKAEQKETTPTKKNEEENEQDQQDDTKTLQTEHILVYIGWLIHSQYLYKEGKLSQEDIVSMDEKQGWSWDTIPTDIVIKALKTMHEESGCTTNEKSLLMNTLYNHDESY